MVIVTNQSGIARGRYTEEHVRRLHQWVDRQLESEGAHIDDWYIAPHHPEYDPPLHRFPSEDRKPGIGMFRKAAEKHGIDFSRSYMAGDKITDLKPALALGMHPFFIRSRHEPKQDKNWLEKHRIKPYNTLLDALNDCLIHSKNP